MAKPQDFKKGDPRINRKGRPKEPWTMTALYKEAGDEADETGVPMKLVVAKKLWKLASKGDVTAIKELGNRIDGMPKQTIDAQIKNIDAELNKLETDYDKFTREIAEQDMENDSPLQDKG